MDKENVLERQPNIYIYIWSTGVGFPILIEMFTQLLGIYIYIHIDINNNHQQILVG